MSHPRIVDHRLSHRVRYHECDAQGRVHHAHYLLYFENGRVELMRANARSYKDFEASGLMLVIKKMEVEYLLPAEFDDLLEISTCVEKSKGARIIHRYEIQRAETLIVRGISEIGCIDRTGAVKRLPDFLQWSDL